MNTLGTILALVLLAPPPASSALHCPAPAAEKGNVKGGPPLVHEFELRHMAADGIVTITGLDAGCGCLRQHMSATVLKPGDTAKLTIEVNTLTQPDGPNRWTVRLHYRHDRPNAVPETGDIDLRVSAQVIRELSLTPPQLAISTTGPVTQTLTLTDRRAIPLTLMKAVSSSPHLKAEIGPRREVVTAITLTLAGDAPPGMRDETVVLYSDDPAYPEFRVPVRIEKRQAGLAAAIPDEVELRFAGKGTPATARVQVRSQAGKDVQIEAVESDHPLVQAKWSKNRGAIATVSVTVAAPTTPGSDKGHTDLRIRLAEPPGQLLVVPVSWTTNR